MKIKTVPSKLFQEALDKWIGYSIGIEVVNNCRICNYCSKYHDEDSVLMFGCSRCPLILACGNGLTGALYKRFESEYKENGLTQKARELADEMASYICQTSVYEV